MYLSLGVKQFEKSSRIKLLSCLGHLDNFHNFINPKENSITLNILYLAKVLCLVGMLEFRIFFDEFG